jgi:glycosyltransferase A (GT-A) superfamily protein (DUF2064 family)
MSESRRALLVFTRTPEAEARAKGFSPEAGALLFAAFLSSWERAAKAAGARFVISSPPRCAERFRARRGPGCSPVLSQSGGRFGERLQNAVGEVFALGFTSVAVVGGDAPALSGRDLDLVFRALEAERSTVVLGPSRDGGVYLVGLSEGRSRFLQDCSPRDRRLGAELGAALERAGREVVRLEVRDELDSIDDLARAYRSCESKAAWKEFRALLASALRQRRSAPVEFPSAPALFSTIELPARAPPAA